MVSNIGRRQMREMLERIMEPDNTEPRYGSMLGEPSQSSSLTPEPQSATAPSMRNWNVQNSIFNSVPANLRFNMNGAQNPAPGQAQQMSPPPIPSTPMGPQNPAPQLPGPGPLPNFGGINPGGGTNPFAAKARAIGLSDYQPSAQSMQANALRGGSNNG